ncbi:MAG TPA: sialidase family protein [Anaerolineales bacterium]|nr:sialidase family protein [Anaerolineales bacterium]
MKKTPTLRRFGWLYRKLSLLFACAAFITIMAPSWVIAQSTDDSWTDPLNLSHSGIAQNPSIVTDTDGVVHVVWRDDFGKYIYTRFEENQWSAPKTTDWDIVFNWSPPLTSDDQIAIYTGPNPLFVSGPGEYVFAFWVSPQGGLFTSKLENQKIGETSWEYARLIASGVGSFAVSFDARGNWHLVYLSRAYDPVRPVGIYYTRSKNEGQSWIPPRLLQESHYFRALAEGESNLSVATAGPEEAQSVYVAWGNKLRRQVFLAQSADGGETWEQPRLIAGPAPDPSLGAPFNIQVGANQESVILLWQSGQPQGTCSQIFQYSKDAGVTWSDPELIINEDLIGCAQSNQFVPVLASNTEGPLYLLTKGASQVFVSAWNGSQWSQPQEQSILSGFEEPEIFSEVIFGCQQASLFGERLYIVGCDEGGGGDVWVTSRTIDANLSGSTAPIWSQLSPVTEDSLELESIELLATDDGLIHAFFSKHQDSAIYYTYWNGELWSRISPVMVLTDEAAGSPEISAGVGNELFLIARSNRGTLYYSRAISGNAASQSRWSPPTQLEIKHDGQVGSADIAWDVAGTVYIAYSVPVNSERGIYLIESQNQGGAWSAPLQLFDGAAAGFDFIGAPSLLTSEEGVLDITWSVQSIQGDGAPQPLSLFYTHSMDSGQTFNEAQLIVEEPVSWREFGIDDDNHLHLLWQPQDSPLTVWDQISMDGGNTWQFPQGLQGEGSLVATTSDAAGRLHVMGVGEEEVGHWLWDDGRWRSEAPLHLPLSAQQKRTVEIFSAAVNLHGQMVVVLAESTGEGDGREMNLLYSTRMLALPLEQTTTEVVATQTVVTPSITAATSTPEPLLTPTFTLDNQGQTDGVETNDPVSPFIMALLPVALLLIVVLGVVIRRIAQAKN